MSQEARIALVTGASRGIGQAIALALGAQGATVVGTATTEAGAQKISATLAEQGISGSGFCLDVCSDESVAAVLQQIEAQFGTPLILVNNAGITRDNLLMRMKSNEWDEVIDTNLSALYRTSKAMLRGMTKARWGRIVNIGSVVGAMGNAGQTNYAAAKAGMGGFTRALAREVGSRGITVNAVAPGLTRTPKAVGDLPAAVFEHVASLQSIPRNGRPDDQAGVVSFLASDDAAFMTGQTLLVDGGQGRT